MEFVSYAGRPCTAQHFLVELACTRKSKKQKIPMSLEKWWQDIPWKKEYARQIAIAHGLLKLFTPESIISALNSKEGSWIYSLASPQLIDLIKTREAQSIQEEKKERLVESKEITFEEQAVKEIAQIKIKKSSIDKLKELE